MKTHHLYHTCKVPLQQSSPHFIHLPAIVLIHHGAFTFSIQICRASFILRDLQSNSCSITSASLQQIRCWRLHACSPMAERCSSPFRVWRWCWRWCSVRLLSRFSRLSRVNRTSRRKRDLLYISVERLASVALIALHQEQGHLLRYQSRYSHQSC